MYNGVIAYQYIMFMFMVSNEHSSFDLIERMV